MLGNVQFRRGGSLQKIGEKWCRRTWIWPNLNSCYWIFIERLRKGTDLSRLYNRCLGRHSKKVSLKWNVRYSRYRDTSVLSRPQFRYCLLVYFTTQRHKTFPNSRVSLCRRNWHKQTKLTNFDVHIFWNEDCSFILPAPLSTSKKIGLHCKHFVTSCFGKVREDWRNNKITLTPDKINRRLTWRPAWNLRHSYPCTNI